MYVTLYYQTQVTQVHYPNAQQCQVAATALEDKRAKMRGHLYCHKVLVRTI